MRAAAGPRQIEDVTRGFTGAAVPMRARRRVDGMLLRLETRGTRAAPVLLVGLMALAIYVLPWLSAPAAHWPLWDARVYWWGGRQAAAGGGTLYAPGAPFSFTYPPFAALLFSAFAGAPEGAMSIALTAGSLVALTVLCGQALAAAGIRRRPEIVFAVSALALQTWPVAYTLHLGEVNLILAALIGTDLLWRRGGSGPPPRAARPAGSSPPEPAGWDGAWWQGIGTGLAAGIKLTPLIFVAYLALTGRLRAAAVAAGTFAVTVAAGFGGLPGPSRTFWLGGVFYDRNRIGDPANPSDQSLSGAVARLAGTGGPAAPLVAGRGARGRPGGPGRRGLGAPTRVPDGRVRLLRRHRPAGLAELLDAPLGLGRPAAGVADRGGMAAPLRGLGAGRGHRRGGLLRLHAAPLAGASGRPGADGSQ
jgi:hypothetical protein